MGCLWLFSLPTSFCARKCCLPTTLLLESVSLLADDVSSYGTRWLGCRYLMTWKRYTRDVLCVVDFLVSSLDVRGHSYTCYQCANAYCMPAIVSRSLEPPFLFFCLLMMMVVL